MTAPPDLILTEEGEVNVRLDRIVASAGAAGGRDQDAVVVFVFRGIVRHGRSARRQQCRVVSSFRQGA